jgi:photosystem II stability/assembly factor-like uncharacterized protein
MVLAILAPSCGGGGGGSSKPPAGPVLPRWSSQYRVPTTSNLRAVRFGNTAQGIVAGEMGTFVRTDDGGASWTQLEFSPSSRNGDVLALSVASTTAVAVGIDAGTGGSAAWTSRDATTWTITDDPVSRFTQPWVDVVIVVPAGNQIQNATYRLRPNGEVDVYQGGFLFTADSRNIQPIPVPVPPNAITPWTTANGVVFFGLSGYGLVCGDTLGGQIRRTSDGGNVWDVLTLTAGPFPPLRRFWMQSTISGFVCGDGGTILQTTDGTNWAQLNNKPGGLATTTFRAISFPADVNTGWVVGDDGTNGVIWKVSFATPNWTWTQETVPAGQPKLYDVSFLDNNTGYAVGDKGTVLKTLNGGTTWSDISQPAANPFPQINAVDFSPNGMTGLAVGNGGLVLRTLDGGLTWVNFNTGVGGANLTGVCIPRSGSGNVAYLCGATNTVRIQPALLGPAGGAWTTPTTLPGGNYESILFSKGDLNGVAVAGAVVSFTTDGGVNWTDAAPGGTFHALGASPDGSTMYAAGDTSVILSSVDDPATPAVQDIGSLWAAITPTLTATASTTLRSIQAPTGASNTLFAAGADGNVYRLSTGAPGTWTITTPLAATVPVSIAFINDQLGWAVTQGANGGIFYTSNGGGSWTRSILHVKINAGNNLRAIQMNATETGWAVGDGGMIMKTTTGGQ